MPYFTVGTKIFFGKDAKKESFEYLKSLGINKIVFLIDKNLEKASFLNNLIFEFKKEKFVIEKIEFFLVQLEPTYDILDGLAEKFRGLEIDAIVGIGGGSIMDLAKGIGILLKNPGKGIEYRGMNKVKNCGVKVICYPTTAGTGSEVTHTASFIDSESKTKLGINGNYVVPLFGVLVPELTFSCPLKVTVSSCLDAMVHALEAVSAKTANDITIMIGSKSFSLLYSNIKKIVKEPRNYKAREKMLLGSYLAGVSMMNAGGGPASGISYPLGVHFKIPHGIAGGVFLPYIIEFNIINGYRGFLTVYRDLEDANLLLNEGEQLKDFSKKFKILYKEIGAPENLSSFGVTAKDISPLAKIVMEQRKLNLDLNPVNFCEKELVELLEKVIK